MPIGDLLAQISGENSSSAPNLQRTSSSTVPAKRKAENDLRPDVVKSSRPMNHPSSNPTSVRTAGGGHGLQKRAPPSQRLVGAKAAASASSLSGAAKTVRPVAGARPTTSSPLTSPSATPKQPLKKGSFAEIIARGQRAQAVMGQVGKIQHKKVEKGATVKVKDDVKPSAPAKTKARTTPGYKGTSKPMTGVNTTTNGTRSKNGARPRPTAPPKRHPDQDPTDKTTKRTSQQPMTGYTGTARPKQGLASKKKDIPRGGALLNAAPARHGSSKRSRYDEDDYDEELDDFIEYDDDDDDDAAAAGRGPGYGHGYASDASSDMEAGIDELDTEEQRAEILARREDIEEERLERSLKAAKEDRKRQALEALRAGKRR
ncbi:chromatin SPT2 [Ophiocordyceps camponoti-floridani]|uniref:Chromatin SPT2 n=1 Tax=Ophiocordyceps camponoti-floridani TaxID=2030778 RepID=A0A8H4Q367_9HYPO|nr:chromatin SPT2 [Ophiocordyceps camponoti-floridani]